MENSKNEILKKLIKRVPKGYLIPAVNNRASYMHLIQTYSPIKVLDIGTGSVGIYLAILALYYPHIKRFGIESNLDSYNNALKCLTELNMDVQLQCCNEIPLEWINTIDFVICNPPFYSSKEAIVDSKNLKLESTSTFNFNGKDFEMIYNGGEVEFIKPFIHALLNSKSLKWFSVQFGFKSSITKLIQHLKFIQSLFGLHLRVKTHKIAFKTVRYVVVFQFILKKPFKCQQKLTESQFNSLILELNNIGSIDSEGNTTTCLISLNSWSRQFKRSPMVLTSKFQSYFTIERQEYDFLIQGDGLSKSFYQYFKHKYKIT